MGEDQRRVSAKLMALKALEGLLQGNNYLYITPIDNKNSLIRGGMEIYSDKNLICGGDWREKKAIEPLVFLSVLYLKRLYR
ncbi:hypothetical protein [Piscirickettsia salmonis]|uniref:hypothetical protein n=1 Tax=Piscirickettsia salmonis TaxID=1238 RepID=UPI00143D0DE3|nr:hypothetical protein [Piscirickettsia salmonis]QIX57606.1 hypothetical protein GW536_19875 [Piscirickettsia salmonis]